MKKYLLTWYGITDLSAALGLGTTEGPVLSALLSEEYTDVIILGYTNPEKDAQVNTAEQQRLLEWCRGSSVEELLVNQSKGRDLVEVFANTTQAHDLFQSWLSQRLSQLDHPASIQVFPIQLKALNDTEGIYSAANMCLDIVSSHESEKEVTVYLSPGTPVMAFTWAFASLVNPGLKIKVIASSEAGKPPELISLPYKLLESSKSKQIETMPDDYDAVFHLFGEQRMPSVLGIMQFPSKRHVFINSKKYPAKSMKQFIGSAKFQEIYVNPFDPKNVEAKILKTISELPPMSRVGFNLTGGTKLMYAGALAASQKIGGIPFYFETQTHNLIYLNNFKVAEANPINNVEIFIQANVSDLKISTKGFWDDDSERNNPTRLELTRALWNKRSKLSKLYRILMQYNDSPGQSFAIDKAGIRISLGKSGRAELEMDNKKYTFDNWPEFAKYLSGGWLEEYTYLGLLPLLKSGQIKDMRIGMEISFQKGSDEPGKLDWKDQLSNRFGELYQELDVVFTNGKYLFIVECKAGNVLSEHVMKLQNIVPYYGGLEGRGILASAFAPYHPVTKKKISDAKNIECFSDWVLANINKKLRLS